MTAGDSPDVGCPRCGIACAPAATECMRCGVVFAKVAQRERAQLEGLRPADPAPDHAAAAAQQIALAVQIGRAGLVLALAWVTWEFARAPMGVAAVDSVLHLPNLVFHEAGHIILGVFGRFLSVLGGSLFQLLVPLVLAGAFIRQRDWFGAAVCTWWAGQNLVDLAPYIADARPLQMVLLGGKTGAEVEGHDWEYLLTQVGWLHLDRTLGLAAHATGLVVMTGALIWGAVCAWRPGTPSLNPGPDRFR